MPGLRFWRGCVRGRSCRLRFCAPCSNSGRHAPRRRGIQRYQLFFERTGSPAGACHRPAKGRSRWRAMTVTLMLRTHIVLGVLAMLRTLLKAFGLLLALGSPLAAQDYPARPVRLIIPFAPG